MTGPVVLTFEEAALVVGCARHRVKGGHSPAKHTLDAAAGVVR